jgi:hypothetical protein
MNDLIQKLDTWNQQIEYLTGLIYHKINVTGTIFAQLDYVYWHRTVCM